MMAVFIEHEVDHGKKGFRRKLVDVLQDGVRPFCMDLFLEEIVSLP